MVMAQPLVHGRFIWQGLITEDPTGAAPFYSKVIGWRAEPSALDPSYTIVSAASGPVAGISKLSDANRAQGARADWMSFIGADDVDALVAQAEKLGAKVHRAAADIDKVGRYAIVADPQGATFALFKPLEGSPPKAGAPQLGELAWHELTTTDPEAALKFYQELFGWQLIHRMDMGQMGFYWIFGSDGVPRGGIFNLYKLPHPAPGPYWTPYFEVADADKAAQAASKAGGRVLNGPMDVPGGGRIAQLADPSGVAFAVHTAPKSAVSSTPAKPVAGTKKPAVSAQGAAPAKVAAKPAARKAAAKKPAPKKSAAKKSAAKKAAAKKAAPKSAQRKAGKKKGGSKKTAARRRSSASSARRAARPARKKTKRGAGQARRKK